MGAAPTAAARNASIAFFHATPSRFFRSAANRFFCSASFAAEAVGIPLAVLGVLLGVDRIPDMFRTCVQVTGHLGAAAVANQLAGPPEATR